MPLGTVSIVRSRTLHALTALAISLGLGAAGCAFEASGGLAFDEEAGFDPNPDEPPIGEPGCVGIDCIVADCQTSGYSLFAEVTVANPQAVPDGYAARVVLDTAALIGAGKLASDCRDLRFVDDAGQLLSHWLEGGCDSATTEVWVSVPALAVGDTTLYVQYGNPAAFSRSNGFTTFPFFDDFDGRGSQGLDGWTVGLAAFQAGHDKEHSEGVDDVDALSTGLSARLRAEASCLTEPFDGVQSLLDRPVDLESGDYCVELLARSDVLDFDFTSSGSTTHRILIDGRELDNGRAVCGGRDCTATSGIREVVSARQVNTAIATLRLTSTATDCITGQSQFDDVRVRYCAAAEPVASVGAELSCE